MSDQQWTGEERRSGRPLVGAGAPPERSALERHVQTILGSLILALMLGVGSLLLDLRDRMARAEEKALHQSQLMLSMRDQIQTVGAPSAELLRQVGALHSRQAQLEVELQRLTARNGR